MELNDQPDWDDSDLDARDAEWQPKTREPRDANGRLIACPRIARFDAEQRARVYRDLDHFDADQDRRAELAPFDESETDFSGAFRSPTHSGRPTAVRALSSPQPALARDDTPAGAGHGESTQTSRPRRVEDARAA